MMARHCTVAQLQAFAGTAADAQWFTTQRDLTSLVRPGLYGEQQRTHAGPVYTGHDAWAPDPPVRMSSEHLVDWLTAWGWVLRFRLL